MRENLPKRKHIRLKEYDYAEEAYYFITICIKNRENILSRIEQNDCYILTKEENIVDNYIKQIELVYSNIKLDEYIIMPNHIHMILNINKKEKNTISKIIQQLKGRITKEIGYSIWQKLFYEHIIRNEKEYLLIKEYIRNNPYNWKNDTYY